MNATQTYTAPDGTFALDLPPRWEAVPDEEQGGVEFSDPDGAGVLHLIGLPQPEDAFPDPAEELYAFLAEQGVELEEDEVEDVELADGSEMTLCEYTSAEDDEDEVTFWLIAVATAPGALVFATYFCEADDAEEENDLVRGMLRSLHLTGAEGAPVHD